MIDRLRRDIRTGWFIVNNVNADNSVETIKLHRKNENWEHNRASGSLEGSIDRFEHA